MTTTTKRRKINRASFGSVRRLPSGRYQARYTDARQVSHTAPATFTTAKQAHDWLAELRADQLRGTWRAPELGAITLADYATDHLAGRLDLAPSTRALYASVFANWVTRTLDLPSGAGRRARSIDLGAIDLRALTVADVHDWHAAMHHTAEANAVRRGAAHERSLRTAALHDARVWAKRQGLDVKDSGRLPVHVLDAWRAAGEPAAQVLDSLGATAYGRDCRSATRSVGDRSAGRAQIAQAYRLVRMLLNHAVREGRIAANPCQIVGAGHVKGSNREPATPEQVQGIADAMPARYRAAVHLAAWSGLRRGELFGLARRHLTLDASTGVGTVRVERAATSIGGKPPVLGPTKTESSRRTVHLPAHVVAILADHVDRYTGSGPDALVFTDPAGRMVHRQVREAFWRARVSVGRPDLRWHDLRVTGATWAAQAGATLRELQHRMGHTTAVAAMLYQRHTADRDRDLAARMGALAGVEVGQSQESTS